MAFFKCKMYWVYFFTTFRKGDSPLYASPLGKGDSPLFLAAEAGIDDVAIDGAECVA
jgi:hypothetical protein